MSSRLSDAVRRLPVLSRPRRRRVAKAPNRPVGTAAAAEGRRVFVSWFIPGSPANTGQASGFLDVNKGDSTLVSVPSPSGLPAMKFPIPTSISGSASWFGGPKPARGIAIDTFTLKVKGPETNGKDVLRIDIAGLDFANGDSVTTTFDAAAPDDDPMNFTGQAKTKKGQPIIFVLSMTTGTQILNLAAA
jgi:hypothetical protein